MLAEINVFLGTPTPDSWINHATQHMAVLLTDHANCEKKAAGTAMNLIFRYVDKPDLLQKMSRLAREELRHFEQVLLIMKKRNIEYNHLSPGRYAAGMRELVRNHEPVRLVDTLVVGAFIEARSCERFAAIAPYLDAELKKFYLSLLKAESRHYQDYLRLAHRYGDADDIQDTISKVRERENSLIVSPDDEFRFHSGVPARKCFNT